MFYKFFSLYLRSLSSAAHERAGACSESGGTDGGKLHLGMFCHEWVTSSDASPAECRLDKSSVDRRASTLL